VAAFATAEELASHLQVAGVDTASANQALNIASSDIRDHCGWSISEEDVTDTLDGTGTRNLWIPTLRLTAVSSLAENGVSLVEGVDFDWTRYGKLVRNGCWPRTARSVDITWTHGYATVPDVVKGVCLALAGRRYDNPKGSKGSTRTAGPFTETSTYAGEGGADLTSSEIEKLGKFTLEEVG
jgi:hypothetical protein